MNLTLGTTLGNTEIVPVFSEYGLIEMASAARARALAAAPNAFPVRRRRDGRIMRIILLSHSEDFARRARRGNPQRDVYHAESDENPANVWCFKRRKPAA